MHRSAYFTWRCTRALSIIKADSFYPHGLLYVTSIPFAKSQWRLKLLARSDGRPMRGWLSNKVILQPRAGLLGLTKIGLSDWMDHFDVLALCERFNVLQSVSPSSNDCLRRSTHWRASNYMSLSCTFSPLSAMKSWNVLSSFQLHLTPPSSSMVKTVFLVDSYCRIEMGKKIILLMHYSMLVGISKSLRL